MAIPPLRPPTPRDTRSGPPFRPRRGRTTTSPPVPTLCRPSTPPLTSPARRLPSTPHSWTAMGSTGTPTSWRGLTTPRVGLCGIPPTMRAAAVSPTTPTPRTTTQCSRTLPRPPTGCARRAGTILPAPTRSSAAATRVLPARSTPSPLLQLVLRPLIRSPARLRAPLLPTTSSPCTRAPWALSRRRVTFAARCSKERPTRISVPRGNRSSRRGPWRMPPPFHPSLGTSLLAFERRNL
mmetsp:Transcript_23071/g.56093  ORF Transcript_23071/g.56093 Transcript_23071/m.56093 type:complete len:237 (+) Transcript_23071:165-875(+)